MFAMDLRAGGGRMITILAIIVPFLINNGFGAGNDTFFVQERRLYKDLMKDYIKAIRPTRKANEQMVVQFGLSMGNIADVDLKTHTLSLNVWLEEHWNDPQLSWDPVKWGGIKSLAAPATDLWRPDISLYNSFGDSYVGERTAVILNNGDVSYNPEMRLRAYCSYDLTRFPYDTQQCTLLFGSWAHEESKMDIQLLANSSEEHKILAYFRAHHEWNVTMVKGQRSTFQSYVMLNYTLTMKRLTGYYTYVFVTPCMLLNLLMPLMFLLPPETRQKTCLGIGIFVCLTILLLMLEMSLPSAFSYVPLIAMFYVLGMILVTISLGMGVLTTCCWEYAPRAKRELPPFLKMVFLGWVGRILCVSRDSYTPQPTDVSTVQQMSQLQIHDPVQELENGGFDLNDRYNVLTVPRVHDVMRADWKALAVTIDRLLFVVFLIINAIVAIML